MNEVSALVRYAGDSVDHLVLTPTQGLHRAVAGRVFGALGPLGRPVRAIHDTVAGATYSAVRATTDTSASLIAAAVRLATGDDFRLLSSTRRGRRAISALNALTGDVLEERGNELAIPMSIRTAGADIECERTELRNAFKQPTKRLAVFIHGLAETEDDWSRRGHSFGARLRLDLGVTPIYIRYNTGVHISQNGQRLSDLMERLVREWPVPVEDVAFIGHSMGGLVARSACHAARSAAHRWPVKLDHLIALGSPHSGVPLEKLVHVAAWVLRLVPESRPLAEILDRRSAGIQDLRFGYLIEDDWRGEDRTLLLHNHRSEVPALDGCTHTFMSAGRDVLVGTGSAAGRGAHSVIHLPGLTHFDLLDHPVVYEQIRRSLSVRDPELDART